MPWSPLPLSYAIAIYPFQPASGTAELPLQIGDQLYVIEQGGKDGSWCRGYLVTAPPLLSALTHGARGASDARVFSGIFPRCCIEIREELGSVEEVPVDPASGKPAAPVPMLKVGDESLSSTTEPLVDEISSCLREWYSSHMPDLVLERQYDTLDQISTIISKLEYARRELLNDVLTAEERRRLQSDAVWNLVRGNKLLGTEIIVRDPNQQGRLVTSEDSAVEMSKLQSAMSVLDEPPKVKSENTRLHHFLVEGKSASGSELETTTTHLALYQKTLDGCLKQFSETFACAASATIKTLFADLSTRDIGSDGQLFLVLKILNTEQTKSVVIGSSDRPPSHNENVRGSKDSLPNRKRSSIMFSSKRKTERPNIGSNGRITPLISERLPIKEEEEEPKKSPSTSVPRLIGAGVLDVAALLRAEKEEERTLTIWSPCTQDDDEIDGWPQILPQLLRSPWNRYTRCNRLPQLELELKPFIASDAEALIKLNPTSMHLVNKTQKIGFSDAPTKKRSDIYFTLSKAIINQGAQLAHPQFGTVPMRSGALPNLQLTMELRDSAGTRLEKCIYASSNGAAVTALRTSAVELGMSWDQTICIRLPEHKVHDAHIVLSIADAPGFPFALAWMPMWHKQTFVKDGKHSLFLHAYDKSTSTINPETGKGAYLSLMWENVIMSSRRNTDDNPVATLEVETQLVSTEFSQNGVLASLLSWKSIPSSAQQLDMLQKLVFVPEIEIVTQLYEVLDALFDILQEKVGTSKFEDLIFNDIVFVLGIVHDRRFNLGPIVERYAEERFEAPNIGPSIVRSFTRLLQSVSDPQSSRDMRALFKVGKQFMKLLMTSYLQRQKIPFGTLADKKHVSFKEDMQAVLFGLQMMMRSETAALVGSKTLLIQNFHTWLPELLAVYSKDEVIEFAISFVDSVEEAEGKLVLHKLVLILNYTHLDQLWMDPKDWQNFVKQCKRWLDAHWNAQNNLTDEWKDQIRLCCSVIAELLKRPIPVLHEFLPTIISTYCTLASEPQIKKWSISLLFSDSYPFTTKSIETTDYFDEAMLELSALASSIIRIRPLPSSKHVRVKRTQQILGTLALIRSLLMEGASPASWLSLHIYNHASAMDMLIVLSHQLLEAHLPEPEQADRFEMELWKSFFDTLLLLVSSPALRLETFSEQKRRAVWKIAGDVRQTGADLLRSTWGLLGWEATADDQRRYNIERLGGFQVQYVPGLVGPLIELCLSMHEGLRKTGVEVLQTMIISEWALSEDLELIETEAIGALNTILKSPAAQSESVSGNEVVARKLFVGELLECFSTIANQPDDALWTALEELVSTIEELIDLLSGNGEADQSSYHDGRQSSLDRGAISSPSQNGHRAQTPLVESMIPDRSASRMEATYATKVYGTNALECYKQLADEYERAGDYKRLAKTHRAIARIHEARAASRSGQHQDDRLHEQASEDEDE